LIAPFYVTLEKDLFAWLIADGRSALPVTLQIHPSPKVYWKDLFASLIADGRSTLIVTLQNSPVTRHLSPVTCHLESTEKDLFASLIADGPSALPVRASKFTCRPSPKVY